MDVMARISSQTSFPYFITRKPFAGVNGSGKHNNWSFYRYWRKFIEPRENPKKNLQF